MRFSVFTACSLSAALIACGGSGSSSDDDAAGGAGSGGEALCNPSPDRCGGSSARPGRAAELTGVYAPDRLELVVFGGTRAVPEDCAQPLPLYTSETWIFDDGCGTWEAVGGPGPTPRARHAAAYGNGDMWVFGGRFRSDGSESGDYTLYNDLLRFDVEAREWFTEFASDPKPPERVNAILVWDSRRELLWLHGGNTSVQGFVYEPQADIWTFDPQTRVWNELLSSGGPIPRLWHAGTYDTNRDALVMYGGLDNRGLDADGEFIGDLWSLDLESLEWTQLDDGSDGGPGRRFGASIAYNERADEYVLVGGHDDQELGNRNDVWSFNPNVGGWTGLAGGDAFNRPPGRGVCDFPADFATIDPGAPERRHTHAFGWSEACQRAVLFGGRTDCGLADDVWSFDGTSWSERVEPREGEVCARAQGDPGACSDLCE